MRKSGPLLLAAAAVMLLGAGCTASSSVSTTTPYQAAPSEPAQNPPAAANGRAVFSVTDAATQMNGVTAVQLTVDKAEVHSAAQGWVTVSSASKTYDLLALKQSASSQLLADANLAAGAYDQVRLHVSKVEVTAKGKTQEAKLPSDSLLLTGKLNVTAGQTSTAQFDFIADQSLHATGDGKYVMAPVVHLRTRSHVLKLDIGADQKVQENGGTTDTDATQGMTLQGDMQANFQLKDTLDIDSSGMVKVHGL